MKVCEELQIVARHHEVDTITERVAELREAVGAHMDFALDFHGRVHAPMAKILLKELEPFRPLFIEDAVVPEQMDTLADLSHSTTIPLCTGERLHSRYAFKQVFEKRAASVINPDVSHTGGISGTVTWTDLRDTCWVTVACL
ncbi:MAG: enolase C-terminal domain-like protein [Yoonia sp.]|nr:enolase C-terminal domain-like protein [Yoonia sp.]